MPLLSVRNLRTHFHTRDAVYRAVDGLDFDLERGEVMGIVGESGSGKSVTCYSLMGLVPQPPGRIEDGSALFDGVDLLKAKPGVMNTIRGRRITMVFQDPMTSLNPFLTIGAQLTEPLVIHRLCSRKEARQRAMQLMDAIGIAEAEKRLKQHPHQLSGGMRQRVMIAMALITQPELMIADEPTTALDVTVQAQILDLIRSQQRLRGMSVIYITHDLAVVAGLCERVLVMYAGRIVEAAPVRELFRDSRHPYTRALQQSIPSLHKKGALLKSIRGLPPDLSKPLPGCAFAERCSFATDACRRERPVLRDCAPGHSHACARAHAGEI